MTMARELPHGPLMIDLDLKAPDLDIPSSPRPAEDAEPVSAFDGVQVSTSVNPDFAAMQSETLINTHGFGGQGPAFSADRSSASSCATPTFVR